MRVRQVFDPLRVPDRRVGVSRYLEGLSTLLNHNRQAATGVSGTGNLVGASIERRY